MTVHERQIDHIDAPGHVPILIVDDSKAQRRLLTRTLEKWGYRTVEAESGNEALRLCETTAFEIIVSDWLMPEMSGVEFCRTFRRTTQRPAYFILLTAQTERERLAEGLESGADDFLSKPFHAVELRARLRAGRRSVRAQRALSSQNEKLSSTLQDLSDAYAAIERDLKGARAFQEGLIPQRSVAFKNTDVSLLFRSSGHVGGDLVGYFPVNEDEIGVYSVDASGHGVASALMTARVAGYLSASSPERNIALRQIDGAYTMAPLPETCARLNNILVQSNDTDLYITMSIAKVHLATGVVDVCQAGHPSPAVQKQGGDVSFLELWSTPLGLVEDGDYATASVTLERGDRVVLYSDGITECPDAKGVLLDEGGLERILVDGADLSGAALVDHLEKRLTAYRGSNEFPDDMSAAVVEFR